MTCRDWAAHLSAIRENERVAFEGLLDSLGEVGQTNETCYVSWFSGIGFTLIQLMAFLRSDWAPGLLERGMLVDLNTCLANAR